MALSIFDRKSTAMDEYRPHSGIKYNMSQTQTSILNGFTRMRLTHTKVEYEPGQDLTPPPPPMDTARRYNKQRGYGPVTVFLEDKLNAAFELRYKKAVAKSKLIIARNNKMFKDEQKGLHRRIINMVGPAWYQELSIEQMAIVDMLKTTLQKDFKLGTVTHTQEALGALGIVLRPNPKHVAYAIKKFSKCPAEFLMTLYHIRNPNNMSYSLNDRIILSSVVHLTIRDTFKELHLRLPSPPKIEEKVHRKKIKRVKRDPTLSPYLQPFPFQHQKHKDYVYKNRHKEYATSRYFDYKSEMYEWYEDTSEPEKPIQEVNNQQPVLISKYALPPKIPVRLITRIAPKPKMLSRLIQPSTYKSPCEPPKMKGADSPVTEDTYVINTEIDMEKLCQCPNKIPGGERTYTLDIHINTPSEFIHLQQLINPFDNAAMGEIKVLDKQKKLPPLEGEPVCTCSVPPITIKTKFNRNYECICQRSLSGISCECDDGTGMYHNKQNVCPCQEGDGKPCFTEDSKLNDCTCGKKKQDPCTCLLDDDPVCTCGKQAGKGGGKICECLGGQQDTCVCSDDFITCTCGAKGKDPPPKLPLFYCRCKAPNTVENISIGDLTPSLDEQDSDLRGSINQNTFPTGAQNPEPAIAMKSSLEDENDLCACNIKNKKNKSEKERKKKRGAGVCTCDTCSLDTTTNDKQPAGGAIFSGCVCGGYKYMREPCNCLGQFNIGKDDKYSPCDCGKPESERVQPFFAIPLEPTDFSKCVCKPPEKPREPCNCMGQFNWKPGDATTGPCQCIETNKKTTKNNKTIITTTVRCTCCGAETNINKNSDNNEDICACTKKSIQEDKDSATCICLDNSRQLDGDGNPPCSCLGKVKKPCNCLGQLYKDAKHDKLPCKCARKKICQCGKHKKPKSICKCDDNPEETAVNLILPVRKKDSARLHETPSDDEDELCTCFEHKKGKKKQEEKVTKCDCAGNETVQPTPPSEQPSKPEAPRPSKQTDPPCICNKPQDTSKTPPGIPPEFAECVCGPPKPRKLPCNCLNLFDIPPEKPYPDFSKCICGPPKPKPPHRKRDYCTCRSYDPIADPMLTKTKFKSIRDELTIKKKNEEVISDKKDENTKQMVTFKWSAESRDLKDECTCMKLYNQYLRDHSPCIDLYDNYKKFVQSEIDKYMEELKPDDCRCMKQPSKSEEFLYEEPDDGLCEIKKEGDVFEVCDKPKTEEKDKPKKEEEKKEKPKPEKPKKEKAKCECKDILEDDDGCICLKPDGEDLPSETCLCKNIPLCTCEDKKKGKKKTGKKGKKDKKKGKDKKDDTSEITHSVISLEPVNSKIFVYDKFPTKRKEQMKLLKDALEALAKDNYPLAKLPDCHQLPHFKLWLNMRCGKYISWDEREKYNELSKKLWAHTERCYRRVKMPELGYSGDFLKKMTWSAVYKYKRELQAISTDYNRRLKQAYISEMREYFPTTFHHEFTTRSFRNCYFAYLPSDENHFFVHRPWEPHEGKNMKNRQCCL